MPPTAARFRLRLSSWGGSIIVHLLVLLFCMIGFVRKEFQAAPGERTARGGIVFKTDTPDGAIFTDADANAFTAEGVRTETKATTEELLEGTFADQRLETSLPTRTIGIGSPGQAGGVNVAALNTGTGFAGHGEKGTGIGPEGKATVAFMGQEGTGNRFVYVIDRSASMSEFAQRPFLAAKKQLIASIESLPETCQFNIIFYNNQFIALYDSPQYATEQRKSEAKRYVARTHPQDGTKHAPALYAAIRQRPDVIFFLTDGEERDAIAPGDLSSLTRLNVNSKTLAQINATQFGTSDSGYGFMKRLAADNNGQYRFINVLTIE